jgi:hypothetical protein
LNPKPSTIVLPPTVPIDVEEAPKFYVKFAKYMVDQEQRKLIEQYYKMTGEDPGVANSSSSAVNMDINADMVDNEYKRNRNLKMISNYELEQLRLQEIAEKEQMIAGCQKAH